MKAYIVKLLKKKISIVFLCVMAVLLGVGVFQTVKPLREYTYEGSHTFEPGVAVEYVAYSDISLAPGVYEIQLEYDSDREIGNFCSVADGTVFSGGLITNGQNLYGGNDSTGYYMWLYESTDSLKVCITYDGMGTLTTGDLTIQETRLMGSRIITLVLFALSIFFGVVVYLAYDCVCGISAEQKKTFLGVTVIALIASAPYLTGVLYSSADLGYHLHRIEGIADGIMSGQFPVRIEPEWVHGHGYANGIFYCGTLLLFPGLLRMAGFTVTESYNAYCIAINIVTAWIAYYCFTKMFRDRIIGLVCCAFHTLSIIRIYKMLMTAAVGEYSAITFLPLIVCGFYLVFAEETTSKEFKKAWLFLGFGYAGLIQSHVLTCEITAFLTVILCVIMWKKVFRKERFWQLAKGALSAAGLSVWFLVPFLDYYINEDMHIKHVSARTIQNRGLYPAQLAINWWNGGGNPMLGDTGMQDSDPMSIGFTLMLAFGVFVALWFVGAWKRQKDHLSVAGKICAVFGGLMMLLSLNCFPWDSIQNLSSLTASLVSSLQFPNRFLGWGTVFCIVLAGCCIRYFKEQNYKWSYYVALICVMIGISTSGIILVNSVMRETNTFRVYNVEGMGMGYISGAEYLIEGTVGDDLFYRDPIVSEHVEIASYEKGNLWAKVSCVNTGNVAGIVDLPLLLYKGYQAEDIETGEKFSLEYGENNTICVVVPEGYEGTFEVSYVVPWYWRVSEIISYLTLGLIIAALVREGILAKREEKR